MTFIALGINHNTATVDVRENLAFSPEDAARALKMAVESDIAREIAILSTCNRMELYCESGARIEELMCWVANFKAIDADVVRPHCYSYSEHEAVRHMMKVASGLDSLILGEPQILGQMKSCYAQADQNSTLGSHLHAAFQQVFSVAKRVRSETAIGENPVSVAYAAVSLAQQIFSDLRRDTALLVGAGETVELVARHLKEQGIKKILVANRTLENAQRLAKGFDGEALLLSHLADYLPRADIVISSTASPLPLIGKGMVEQALKIRRRKPMFMVDIAVPRDIEVQVGELNDVFLYTVDDLTEVIDENRRSREKAALIAEEIIDEGVKKYHIERQALGSVDTIRAFRDHVTQLKDIELDRALKALKSGQDPKHVIERLANGLSKKFMHEPTTSLKKPGTSSELLRSLKQLFSLSESRDPDN